jgi:hypothetical protein
VDNLYLSELWIYTMLNHSFNVSPSITAGLNTEYSNSDTRALLLKEVTTWLQNIKIPGLLLFC